MRTTAALGVAMTCALLAGCTSSASSSSSAPPASPTSTPATTASATPTVSPTPSATPTKALSPFEQDPAVQGLRTWAAEAARTVNSGHYTSAALRRLGTESLNKQLKPTLVTDVGLHYPGPVPFTPKSVRVVDASTRDIKACFISTGFAQRPATHRPAEKLSVLAVDSVMIHRSGRWVLSRQHRVTNFSCKDVKVAKPTWTT